MRGQPDGATINKKLDCSLGSGIKWENVDLFYSDDDTFPDDFIEFAPLGKYYVQDDEIKEDLTWEKPEDNEEEEWP